MISEVDLDEVLEKLNEEDKNIIQQYINELQGELDQALDETEDLQTEVESLEEDINDLEWKLEEEQQKGNPYKNLLEEIIQDKYFHIRKDYNSLEKVLDRIEFCLHYGE